MGSWIVDKLIEEGYTKVYSLDDLSGGFIENKNDKAKTIIHDLSNTYSVENIINNIKPKIIFHLAASAHEGASQFLPRIILQRNYESYINLITPAIKNGLEKIVLFSTMAIYGDQKPPFDEKFDRKPVDIYGINKTAMGLIFPGYIRSCGFAKSCFNGIIFSGFRSG